MKIKIKKLSDQAVVPKYAQLGDACMDLTATKARIVEEMDYGFIEYGTDLAFEIPEGYVGLVYPRSSISKTGLILANAVCVIDSGYRGEVTVRFKYIKSGKRYEVGERVAQLMIIPIPQVEFEEVDELSKTERGEGSYGSTGS